MEITGRSVLHTRFGPGIIKSCEGGVLQVYFQQYGARCFHYPEVFDKFISTDDAELADSVSKELEIWRSSRAAQDALIAETCAQAVTKTPKPAPKRRRKTAG